MTDSKYYQLILQQITNKWKVLDHFCDVNKTVHFMLLHDANFSTFNKIERRISPH